MPGSYSYSGIIEYFARLHGFNCFEVTVLAFQNALLPYSFALPGCPLSIYNFHFLMTLAILKTYLSRFPLASRILPHF
jgi:hypothetical protein